MKSFSRELVGGPLDGARVHSVGGELPYTLYVGTFFQEGGYAGWSNVPSGRHPLVYHLKGNRYVYAGKGKL